MKGAHLKLNLVKNGTQ